MNKIGSKHVLALIVISVKFFARCQQILGNERRYTDTSRGKKVNENHSRTFRNENRSMQDTATANAEKMALKMINSFHTLY